MSSPISLKEDRSYQKFHSKVRKAMNKFIRKKKRNVKPLYYTDEESDSDDTKRNFFVENKTCGPEILSESVQKMSSIIQSCDSINSDSKFSKEQINNREHERCNIKGKKCQIEKDNAVEKEIKHDSSPQVSRACDSEIQIVQEFLKLEVCKEVLTAKEAEDDLESREDGEDDTSTVIFEDELHAEDVFQEEVVGKKFKEKQITNRKKQRLVKFKRKSMAGRNVPKFRKSKGKSGEILKGSAQEHGEKPTESGNEECLMEVSGLVKRLYEMHGIILQLQKELPNHGELAIHFVSVIKAQQENLNKEIKKSQKTIIKGYERLMMTYKETGKVAMEISKRTSLPVEDIISILSKCVIVQVCSDTAEKTGSGQYRTISENSEKPLCRKSNRAAVGSSTLQQSPSYPFTLESAYRLNREPPDCPKKDFHSLITRKSKSQIGPPRLEQFPQHGFYPGFFNPPALISCEYETVRNQPLHISPQFHRMDFPHVNAIPRFGGFQQSPPVPRFRYILPRQVPSSSYRELPHQVLESSNRSTMVGNFRTVPPPAQNPKSHPMRRSYSTTSTNTVKDLYPAGSFVRTEEVPVSISSTESQNSANQVLDPTVPQKLTMRNCRLEAGPVLSLRAEDSDASVRPKPSTDVWSLNSTSRKYVCAQNDCKNPGVRICKRCHSVIYCSEACQLQHWTMKHKVECYQLRELRG